MTIKIWFCHTTPSKDQRNKHPKIQLRLNLAEMITGNRNETKPLVDIVHTGLKAHLTFFLIKISQI